MRLSLIFLLSSLFFGTWSTTVEADNHVQQGMVFENFFHIKETNTQVALPPGKWEVAAVTETPNNISTYMLDVILFQENGGTVSRVVYFKTPLQAAYNGYVESKYCSRDSLHYRKTITSAAGGDQDCRWLNHQSVTLIGSKSKLKNAAGEYYEKKNITAPHHMITSGYRFADIDRFINIWYLVNPQVDGFPDYPRTSWRESPWHPVNVVISGPRKIAYIKRLIAWTDEWYLTVKAGWEEKLTGAPTASPTPTAAVTEELKSSKDIAGRLKQLDALFKQELISKDEYERKRQKILNRL